MKYADINKKYTEIVSDYLKQGFIINTATMSGTQGETAKVDLTDGTSIIRVILSLNKYARSEILVGECTESVVPNISDDRTVWNSQLKQILCEGFYYIDKDLYVGESEMHEIREKRARRYTASYTENKQDITEKAREIAKKIIRNEFGYTRINDADIRVTRKSSDKGVNYIVEYRNYYYRLK